MLKEWMSTWGATSAPGAESAGLIKEAAAIIARYNRCSSAWQDHLQETKTRIKNAVHKAPQDKPIVLLGVGPCLDIPLDVLGQHPGGTLLFDAVFLRQTLRTLKSYPNIQAIPLDLTGLLQSWFTAQENTDLTVPQISLPLDEEPGLIISVNMLSQILLNILPFPLPEERLPDAIALVEQHIALLTAYDCPALLITDFARYETGNGRSRRFETIPHDALPNTPKEHWTWAIAPRGEINPRISAHLKVGAWFL